MTISAALILISPDDRMLMQHRSGDAPRGAGRWGFFGGQVEPGETPAEAVLREALEELDYPVAAPRLALTVEGARVVHYFVARQDVFRTLALREGQGLGWFTRAEALALDLTDIARAGLSRIDPTAAG